METFTEASTSDDGMASLRERLGVLTEVDAHVATAALSQKVQDALNVLRDDIAAERKRIVVGLSDGAKRRVTNSLNDLLSEVIGEADLAGIVRRSRGRGRSSKATAAGKGKKRVES